MTHSDTMNQKEEMHHSIHIKTTDNQKKYTKKNKKMHTPWHKSVKQTPIRQASHTRQIVKLRGT